MENGLVNFQREAGAREIAGLRNIIAIAVGVPDHERTAELPGDFIARRRLHGGHRRPGTLLACHDGRAVQFQDRPVSAAVLERVFIGHGDNPGSFIGFNPASPYTNRPLAIEVVMEYGLVIFQREAGAWWTAFFF